MPFGCALHPAGGARFRLWAPSSATAILELTLPHANAPARHSMRKLDGWHEIDVADASEGASYRFVVESRDRQKLTVPDPASRENPEGVHGASLIVDPKSYVWRVPEWRGQSWADAVLYEL